MASLSNKKREGRDTFKGNESSNIKQITEMHPLTLGFSS